MQDYLMRFCKQLLLIAGYQLSVFILLLFILGSGIVPASLSESTLTHWDALHYTAIRDRGYAGYESAFFPLFPYTWHLLQASATSIALLNWSVFSIGMALLATAFEARRSELLLLLSVPSLMFMYLPYTEAFFFLFAVLLILGLKEKNLLLTTLGILLCGIVRPTAVVFAPALLATFYFCEKEKRKALLKALVLAALTCAVFFSVLYFQSLQNGNWHAFFDEQKTGWGNSFRFPSLPLTSWSGWKIVMLDGTALLFGLSAAVFTIYKAVLLLRKKTEPLAPELFFSLLYLSGMALIVLFYRGGSLFSLNRFVFAGPFLSVALIWFLRTFKWNWKSWGLYFFSALVFWLLFRSYTHIQYLLKFVGLTAFIGCLPMLSFKQKRIATTAYILFFALSVFVQIYMLLRFLNNEWVG